MHLSKLSHRVLQCFKIFEGFASSSEILEFTQLGLTFKWDVEVVEQVGEEIINIDWQALYSLKHT